MEHNLKVLYYIIQLLIRLDKTTLLVQVVLCESIKNTYSVNHLHVVL